MFLIYTFLEGLRWNSRKYNIVEVSGNYLEISQTWGFYLSFCLSTQYYSWTNLSFLRWLTDFLIKISETKKEWYGFLPFNVFLILVLWGKDVFISEKKKRVIRERTMQLSKVKKAKTPPTFICCCRNLKSKDLVRKIFVPFISKNTYTFSSHTYAKWIFASFRVRREYADNFVHFDDEFKERTIFSASWDGIVWNDNNFNTILSFYLFHRKYTLLYMYITLNELNISLAWLIF